MRTLRGFGEAVYEYIRANVPEEDILTEEPMSRHTTFRIGGEAACFIRISSEEQLRKLIPYFENVGVEYFVLGKGSNLLVGDKGYPGVILQISDACQQIEADGNRLQVQAGAALSKVALFAMERGLEGLEFAAGIPGTVGGGVVMNAGAYGGEMKQVVDAALAAEGPTFCEIFTDTQQVWEPKSATKRLPDGTLVSPPLEDLAPFLPREELEKQMFIPLVPEQ